MLVKAVNKSKSVEYELTYKNVKNINLRIKSDGTVHVSANRWIPQNEIDGFVLSKADFIQKAQENFRKDEKISQEALFTEQELKDMIYAFCQKAYEQFEKRGVQYPDIKFRSMVSRWGSCHTAKKTITFSTKLVYAPKECIEYVVYHEFTHFLQANHSALFYEELQRVFPDWKLCRRKLKQINTR